MFLRLEVQAHIRRTSKNPSEDNNTQLALLRERLAAEFMALEVTSLATPQIAQPNILYDLEDGEAFENIDELDQCNEGASHDLNLHSIERRSLPLPSYLNVQDPNAAIELSLRVQQAARLLHAVRSTIADKSFQFSHVLRVAPRKSVKTRARNSISKLNVQLGNLCSAYQRCRAAMLHLGADGDILDRFKVLTPADVKSSTALLNPNIPGSSTLTLSWLWLTNAGSSPSTYTLLECKHE